MKSCAIINMKTLDGDSGCLIVLGAVCISSAFGSIYGEGIFFLSVGVCFIIFGLFSWMSNE